MVSIVELYIDFDELGLVIHDRNLIDDHLNDLVIAAFVSGVDDEVGAEPAGVGSLKLGLVATFVVIVVVIFLGLDNILEALLLHVVPGLGIKHNFLITVLGVLSHLGNHGSKVDSQVASDSSGGNESLSQGL